MTPFLQYEDVQVAMIGKCGSSSISQAIVLALNPDYKIVSGSGRDVSRNYELPGIWQASAPRAAELVCPFIPIRNPLERFISAVAQGGGDVNKAIAAMERGQSFHYRPVTEWMENAPTFKLIKFPDDLHVLAEALKVKSLPKVNVGKANNPPKPKLTKSQIDHVNAHYQSDWKAFESLSRN